MLAAAYVFLSLLTPCQTSAVPRYTLDVREAPTSAVFAMMLDEYTGSTITVMRHFPTFVTLRLTEAQVTLPPPDPNRGYGDYWPIGGWLMRIQRAMGVKGLLLGHEKGGGAFYVSCDGMPNTVGSEEYEGSIRSGVGWHRVWTTGKGESIAPPADATPSSFRLAAVRWTEARNSRRAVLVVRSNAGEAFTRVIKEGDSLGVANLQVASIEDGQVTLSRPESAQVRLALRPSR